MDSNLKTLKGKIIIHENLFAMPYCTLSWKVIYSLYKNFNDQKPNFLFES
jgi:hypothetical protein